MNFYGESDLHGRSHTPALISQRQERRIKGARKNLFHRSRNGVLDPITFYHVLDTLLDVLPGQVFRTPHLIEELNKRVPMISWDSVTVGRVINDLAESVNEAAGGKAIAVSRHYDGLWYDISPDPELRTLMEKLLEDLLLLSEKELQEEARGIVQKRIQSPMEFCPSVKL